MTNKPIALNKTVFLVVQFLVYQLSLVVTRESIENSNSWFCLVSNYYTLVIRDKLSAGLEGDSVDALWQ